MSHVFSRLGVFNDLLPLVEERRLNIGLIKELSADVVSVATNGLFKSGIISSLIVSCIVKTKSVLDPLGLYTAAPSLKVFWTDMDQRGLSESSHMKYRRIGIELVDFSECV